MLGIFSFNLKGEIYKLILNGPIDSISDEYITDSFKKIEQAKNAKLIIIELDTPGGLSSSMRSIIKNILNSPIPVAVYVAPRGARAGSAGFYITVSADIAAMSPDTNMGSAHPVSATGQKISKTMNEKITNDAAAYIKAISQNKNRNIEYCVKAVTESKNYSAQDCLANNVIDLIAESTDELLEKIEGKVISKTKNQKVKLENLKGENIIVLEMSGRQKFLRMITNPNLAYFLLLFGIAGLYIEFTHPGGIIPGVLGGISLLLAFFAFQVLPINFIGILLILLAIGLFIAEIKVQGFGVLGIGGVVAFFLGSIILIDSPIPEMKPALALTIPLSLSFGIIFLFLTYKVIHVMRSKVKTGIESLIGRTGIAKTQITKSSGKIFIHGEWWNAISYFDDKIPKGSKVRIETIDNFTVKVSKIISPD